MGWADRHIEMLLDELPTTFRPRGNSMAGIIKSGQECTLEPTKWHQLKVNDVVLCKVAGNQYLHLIGAISHDTRYRIENASGRVNGWIGENRIYGKLTSIDGISFT